jgi:phosphonate transport system permease protein
MIATTFQRYLGSRRATLLIIALSAITSFWILGLNPLRLFSGNLTLTGDFLLSAFRPALDYQKPVEGAEPFLLTVISATLRTLRFALLAMSVAIPCGALLAFLASTAWWPDIRRHKMLGWALRPLCIVSRAMMAFARSIHELIWGLLFMTAMGMSTDAAIIAVAIPYSGILAKIYSEMFEEHSRKAQLALRAIGAGSVAAFLAGLLPRTLPDLITYTFYRLECAVRTAAVFGLIVGIETIGYRIKLASDEFHYREVWTYLYVLFALIIIIEWWSRALRKRMET